MGQFYDAIPAELIPWLLKQEIFWVATAPLERTGHVNVSPKGVRDSFHALSPTRVWYQDLTGSGVETIAHVRENGRVTLLFCAFEGPPRIVRLFGTGTVHEFGTPEYGQLISPEHRRPGSRAAIVIDVHKVGSSCGYAVPYYEFRGHRQTLLNYLERCEQVDRLAQAPLAADTHSNTHAGADTQTETRVKGGMKAYWAEKNARSIDGIPGLADAPNALTVPKSADAMKRAESAEDGRALGETVGLRRLGTRAAQLGRVGEWAMAFALGLAVALAYVRIYAIA